MQIFIARKEAEKYHELALISLQRNVTINLKTFKPCFKQLSKHSVSEKDSGLDIQYNERQADKFQAQRLENTQLKIEIINLKKLNEDKQAMLDESVEAVEASKRKSKMFEDHSSLLASRNHELTEKIKLLEDELVFRNEQLQDVEKESKDLIKKLKEEHDKEIINSVQKIEGLEIQVNALKKQVEDDQKSTIQEKDEELEASRQLMLQSESGVLADNVEGMDKLVNDQLDAKDEQLSGVLVKQEDEMVKRKMEDESIIAEKDENIKDLREEISEQNLRHGSTTSKAAEKDLQLFAQRQENLALQSVIERKEEEKSALSKKIQDLLAENTKAYIELMAEQDERVRIRKACRLNCEAIATKCSSLERDNIMYENKAGELACQLEADKTVIEKLERQIDILDERLGTKDLLIGQLLHQKRRRTGLRRLLCF